jgi:protein ImuB
MYAGLHAPQPLPSESPLVDLAREFTPRLEIVRPSLLLLDLKGLGRLWPSPEELGRALIDSARRRRVDVQLALAATRSVALVVARARAGLTIVPLGQEAAILAPLPLALLDLSQEHATLLRRWGLTTLGDLAALPPEGLAARLGPQGPTLRRLARGEEESLLVPTREPESFGLTLDLDWPVDGLEPLSFLLMQVLEPLCQRLVARERRAAALTLTLRLADGSSHQRALRPAAPSAEARTWRTLLLLDLEAQPPREAVIALTVRAEPAPARFVQFSFFDRACAEPERLAATLARLHEWVAGGRGGSPLLLDTHRPGAFVLATFDPPPWRGAVPTAQPPARARVALRVFRPPLRVDVALTEGTPAFVSGEVRGAVTACAGPWRASGDWWDVAWSREEWDVALRSGGTYRLFRDCLTGEWFVEGELD